MFCLFAFTVTVMLMVDPRVINKCASLIERFSCEVSVKLSKLQDETSCELQEMSFALQCRQDFCVPQTKSTKCREHFFY